ncbi:MAG TPA: DNA repair protein RecN [Alphaproteobacteria bacterium]|nr:DNA repair protein RecN [Alphaproteobacteria bacterium]
MLERLTINNVVLVEKQQVELEKGFIALTGETGAGKSVFIDSIALALGQRANAEYIRHGEDSAIIQADFYFKDDHQSIKQLQEFGIDVDGNEFSIRRKITSDGRSAIFVNGNKINQSQIKSIATHLVDMHSQYDNQVLLDAKNHVELLDSFAGVDKTPLKAAYKDYRSKKIELDGFKDKANDQERELALQKSYLEELEILDIKENEVDDLIQERKALMSAEKVIDNIQTADNYLSGDLVNSLQMAEKSLTDASMNLTEDLAKKSEDLINRLANLSIEVEDVAGEVNYILSSIEVNPARLIEVDDRLFGIKDCARKHKVEPFELPSLLLRMREEVAKLENFEQNLDALETAVATAKVEFKKQAAKVAKVRVSMAEKLSAEIESVLQNLHMKNAKFKVNFTDLDFDSWTANGSQAIEFFVATNLGQKLSSLAKVASGGEVARLMLALKVVFFKNIQSQTLVFDEIDTGVGGQVADSVGECLKELSKQHQVIVISHQAQVASKANQHLKIEKAVIGDATVSSVRQLEKDEVIDELARMISGKEITEESKMLAEKLLG